MVDVERIKAAYTVSRNIAMELGTWARVSEGLQGELSNSPDDEEKMWPWLLACYTRRLEESLDRVEVLLNGGDPDNPPKIDF